VERRPLATVLFTDIVGSTERAVALGDRRWTELLQRHREIVRSELRRHGGREVVTTGDGFLAIFDEPEQAIRCACAIRDAAEADGLQVRSGLHMGKVEREAQDVAGITVHIGARVANEAAPGEVLVSSTVRDTEAGSGFVFEDRGEHALKGVVGLWRLYAVTGVPEEAARSRVRLGSLARSRIGWTVTVVGLVAAILIGLQMRSGGDGPAPALAAAAPGIAVLPFEVRGEDLDVWREGMVDLLSTGLDGAADLRAIDSRTVLARWAEHAPRSGRVDLATSLQVARAAGARYAILGSVVAVRPNVRLVADVYEVEGGRSLGRAQVEGSQEEMLSLVDRLAIASLGVILEKDQGLPEIDLASITTTSLPALKAYLEGELHLRRGEFQPAATAYERAVEADSTFALAWFGLGQAASWLGASGSSPRVRNALDRAAAGADRLPERQALIVQAYREVESGSAEHLEPLRQAVRKYPDDARMWYFLGEMYFHRSDQALVGHEEAAEAFRRAVELEPRFAPYWVHVVNLAFQMDPDSARAARAIEAYSRIAPTDVVGHRLAHAIAFGDPASRARARSGLDTIDYKVLSTAQYDLYHPRFYDELVPLMVIRLRRGPPNEKSFILFELATQSFEAGRIRRALGYLDDPRISRDAEFAQFVHCGPYAAYSRGLPISHDRLDRTLSPAAIDSAPGSWIGCVGAWAADRGRWEDHARVMEALKELSAQALGEADSAASRRLIAVAEALEGYRAWKRGRPEEALRVLEAAHPYLDAFDLPSTWWMGKLLTDLRRPADAVRYFRAQTFDPLGHAELGRLYEALGEDAKARKAYEYFVMGWKDADPELQPRVEEVRERLARLSRERSP
jgi:class 3 adenylate cyclase/tetratricopeptide (TPR) repeat protein